MQYFLWEIMLPATLSLLVVIVPVLLVYLGKKLGDSIDANTKAKLNEFVNTVVLEGVYYADQLAKQRQKEGLKPTGNEKLDTAVRYVVDQFKNNGLNKITEDVVVNKIESYLGLQSQEELVIGGNLNDEDNDDVYS